MPRRPSSSPRPPGRVWRAAPALPPSPARGRGVAGPGAIAAIRRLGLGWTALLALIIAVGCGAMVASAQFDLAVQAFEQGQYDTSIARLEQALRDGGDSARVRTLLGWNLYRKGDLGRARAEFERALRLDASNPNAFYAHEGLGWIAYKTGDHDRALQAFAESLRLSPGYHNAHDGLGWAYLARRDLVRAEANFKAALSRAPADTDAHRGLGFVAYHRGDWDRAIERLRDVVRRDPSDTLSRSALGWSLYYKGDYAAARPVFQEVARREPGWADPLAGLAWTAEREGRGPEAKASFREAIARGAAYVAGPDLRALLRERTEWVDLWRDLGWGQYHQRAFASAENEFRALVARHPTDAEGHRGLGYTLHALRRCAEAVPSLRRSLELDPELPPVKELVEIPEATGLHPIVSDAASTLAWCLYRTGDTAEAARLFREVTRKRSDWADAWSGLGWTLAKTGQRTEAERAFRRSLEATPGYPDALVGLRALGKPTQ